MNTTVPSTRGTRYVLTDAGREALRSSTRCWCQIRLTGLIMECRICGTVYGLIREQSATSSPVVPKKA